MTVIIYNFRSIGILYRLHISRRIVIESLHIYRRCLNEVIWHEVTVFPKFKRVIDQDLLDYIKTLNCIICGFTPCDPDHVITRGPGGSDSAINVWPLCHKHHIERHNKGLGHMIRTYEGCRIWLENASRYDMLSKYGMA